MTVDSSSGMLREVGTSQNLMLTGSSTRLGTVTIMMIVMKKVQRARLLSAR